MTVEQDLQTVATALKSFTSDFKSSQTELIAAIQSSSSGSTKSSGQRQVSKAQLERDRNFRNSSNTLAAWTVTLQRVNMASKELAEVIHDDSVSSKKKNKLTQKLIDAQNELNEQMGDSALIESRVNESRKLLGKSLGEQVTALNHSVRGFSALQLATSKTARASSLLGASLIETNANFQEGSREYVGYINGLYDTTKGLNESILRGADLIDSTTGEIRDNLSPRDFAELRLRLGAVSEVLNESFAGFSHLGVDGLQSAISKQAELLAKKSSGVAGFDGSSEADDFNKLTASFKQATENVILQNQHLAKDILGLDATFQNASGLNIKFFKSNGEINRKALDENGKLSRETVNKLLKNLNPGQIANIAANLGKLEKSLVGPAKKFDALGNESNSAAGKITGWIKGFQATGGAVGFLKEKLLNAGLILGGLTKIAEGVKQTWGELSSFNIAQVPAAFVDVQKASVSLGLNFNDTVKFLQENKRLLAIYGGNVGAATDGLKSTFAKFGYTVAQGAELVGPAIEAGVAAGIDVSSTQALNKFIDSSLDSFKNISGIVNITAKEYLALNAELLNSQDIQNDITGLDQERARQYAADNIALRDHYVNLGLSTQAANDLLKAQAQQKRASVVDKARDTAKNVTLAQLLGFSDQEVADLQRLGNSARTSKDDVDRYAELQGKLGVQKEKYIQAGQDTGGIAGYQTSQSVVAALSSSNSGDQALQAAGLKLNQASIGGQKLDQKTQGRPAGELATGSEKVAEVGNVINSVSSLLDNGFSKAIYGAITALLGFSAQLLFSGGGKGILNLGKGALGKLFGSGGAVAAGGALGSAASGGIEGAVVGAGKSTASKILGKAGAIGAVAYGAYEGYSDYTKASDDEASGKITHSQAVVAKGGAVGKGTGTAVGALAGAAAGAAIGSLVPIVGTVIGGLIGGAIGVYAGGKGGEAIGSTVTDSFANTPDAGKFKKSADAIAYQQSQNQIAQVGFAPAVAVTPGQSGTSSKQNTVNSKSSVNSPVVSDATEKTFDVNDEISHNKLTDIAENMVMAVKYLQMMSENINSSKSGANSFQTSLLNSPQIPTTYSYVTGRQ